MGIKWQFNFCIFFTDESWNEMKRAFLEIALDSNVKLAWKIQNYRKRDISPLYPFFSFFFFIARKLNCGKRRFPIKRLCISHWKPILYNFVKSLFFYNFSHSKLQDEVLWSFFLKTYVLWANLKNHMNREQWKKQSELREKRSRRHFLISFFSPKDLTFCYNTVCFLF